MKIKYCTDDFLEEYKTNFDSYIDLYLNNEKIKFINYLITLKM